MRQHRKILTTVAAGAAVLLGLTACGAGSTDEPTTGTGATEAGDLKEISIALPPGGWPEGDAATYLWANLLESEGYTVDLRQGGDMGVVYTALAGGEYDLFFDMWLPITHGTYLEEYEEDFELIGAWYDDARLTFAVNEDSPVQSLEDLADQADAYGNKIVGIEPGAGLTRVTKEAVIPTYGLEGMDFTESSTPAMLAELRGAIDKDRDILVTLWRPHWAYDAFPIRDLEDPEGALGDTETIEVVGRAGFTEDFPQVAAWLENFTLTGEQLHSLENIMFNENDGKKNEESVGQWLEENPGFFDDIKAASGS